MYEAKNVPLISLNHFFLPIPVLALTAKCALQSVNPRTDWNGTVNSHLTETLLSPCVKNCHPQFPRSHGQYYQNGPHLTKCHPPIYTIPPPHHSLHCARQHLCVSPSLTSPPSSLPPIPSQPAPSTMRYGFHRLPVLRVWPSLFYTCAHRGRRAINHAFRLLLRRARHRARYQCISYGALPAQLCRSFFLSFFLDWLQTPLLRVFLAPRSALPTARRQR